MEDKELKRLEAMPIPELSALQQRLEFELKQQMERRKHGEDNQILRREIRAGIKTIKNILKNRQIRLL